MKFLHVFVAILSSLKIASGTAKSSEFLDKMASLREQILEYQSSAMTDAEVWRMLTNERSRELSKKTWTLVANTVKNISVSDDEYTSLAQLDQNSCVSDLVKLKDSKTAMLNSAIFSCVSFRNASLNSTKDHESHHLLMSVENDINDLPELIIDTFGGRNIFTQGDSIGTRVLERFNATKTVIGVSFSRIRASLESFGVAWDDKIKEMQSCLKTIEVDNQFFISSLNRGLIYCTKPVKVEPKSAGIEHRVFLAKSLLPQFNGFEE